MTDHVLIVDPVLVMLFARSIGDLDPVYQEQLSAAPGDSILCPPTFVQAAEHFDPGSTTRPQLPKQVAVWGGSGDRLHAEQHFEYFRALRAHESLVARRKVGDSWERSGSRGLLEFTETITEFVDASGNIAVRARRVGVRVLGEPG